MDKVLEKVFEYRGHRAEVSTRKRGRYWQWDVGIGNLVVGSLEVCTTEEMAIAEARAAARDRIDALCEAEALRKESDTPGND